MATGYADVSSLGGLDRRLDMSQNRTFTDPEIHSLQLERFIFHIIKSDEPAPRLLDEVELASSQRHFFARLVRRACSGTQFVYVQNEAGTAGIVEARANEALVDQGSFVQLSKDLAAHFRTHHNDGRISDGVLVVATFSVEIRGANRSFLVLMKMDHQEVLQFTTEETATGKKATVTHLDDTFVEDRSATQKSAIVDVENAFAWDVLAVDRTQPEVAGFFRRFLSMQPRHDSTWLTKEAYSTVVRWARDEDEYPEGESVSSYRERALSFLTDNDSFDTDRFIATIVRDPDDAARKAEMSGRLHDALAEAGVSGQTFTPRPGAIKPRARQAKLSTGYGVVITWEGEVSARRIDVQESNNEYIVTIVSKNDPRRE
jgi:hypothetical protein